MQTLEQFETLRSPEGETLLERIGLAIAGGQNELQIATRFRAEFPGDIVAAAMTGDPEHETGTIVVPDAEP